MDGYQDFMQKFKEKLRKNIDTEYGSDDQDLIVRPGSIKFQDLGCVLDY